MTRLFCDLVGFTARAESMDPEDVRRVLQPYHARVRAELERFSGTVEKFVGDAVMAVFGLRSRTRTIRSGPFALHSLFAKLSPTPTSRFISGSRPAKR